MCVAYAQARTHTAHPHVRVYYLKTQIPVEAERPPNLKQQDTQLIMLSHKTNNRTNNRRLSFFQECGGGVGQGWVGWGSMGQG